MSTTERRKGADAERTVIREHLRPLWPDVERTSNGRSQDGGKNDVANGPLHFAIEVKRQERLNVPAAFDQLRRDSDPDKIPLLIHRPSRHEWMATMPLKTALHLIKTDEEVYDEPYQ